MRRFGNASRVLKRLLTRIRSRQATLRHGLGFPEEALHRIYRTTLNHSKVVHFRDGFPVYSIISPATYSKPSAQNISRMVTQILQNRALPNMMSFAVTDLCNADCPYCSFAGVSRREHSSTLSLQEARKLIGDAQDLGVSVIAFVGGEPLLRPDFDEILKCVDTARSTTVLFTNGSHLAPRARDLRRLGLDGVFVSLNSASPLEHDTSKGRPGIFSDALKGIERSLRAGLSVGISVCLSERGFREGRLEGLLELARRMGVHEVFVFHEMPVGSSAVDHGHSPSDNLWLADLRAATESYNQNPDYPGILLYDHVSSFRSLGCHGGTSYFYVSPYGDVFPCDFFHRSHGNVKTDPLHVIWDRMTSSTNQAGYASWTGCRACENGSHCLEPNPTGGPR